MPQRDEFFDIFENTLDAIASDSSDIIDAFLPQRGNTSDDCQMLTLRNATHELDHAITGTKAKDMRPVNDEDQTKLEQEWNCEPFSKDIAIHSIDSLIEKLQHAREKLIEL
jgi:hypothetical protein